jgi:hypothetical protein
MEIADMDQIEAIGQSLCLVAGVIAYVLISYAAPRELLRKSLERHYRDWIVNSKAYWLRASDKWVINQRIYYTDELRNDVLVSVLFGTFGGLGGIYAFVTLTSRELAGFLAAPTIPSTVLLLFVLTQVDRVRLIDTEIALRKLIDPQFDHEVELNNMLSSDRKWIRKVFGAATSKQ